MAEKHDPTRRDFVKTAGAATAAVGSACSASGVRKGQPSSNPVPYAVVGTGERGCYLLRRMAGLENGRCVAVCDLDAANLKNGVAAAGTNPQACQDYRELLARQDIDAVIIATPLHTHFPITRDALLADKHVFCEAPLVFKAHEVEKLRTLASERSQQVLQVGLERRYSAYYQAAKTMVAKGLIGNVTHIIAQWHQNPGWRLRLDLEGRKESNWKLYRECSGGLTAELLSHQIDVASWMFGSQPEFVIGIGGQEFIRDGRDVYDNVQLMYRYPRGQKFVCTAISTNQHLPLFEETRAEVGERIMGTGGTIEITLGTDTDPGIALWYYKPRPTQVSKMSRYDEGTIATATVGSFGYGTRGYPILLEEDQFRDDDPFLRKELKHARRWLYAKRAMMPKERRSPVDVQMESFFDCCRTGARPRAEVRIGLANSTAVILSNLAMDEERRVYFSEIEKVRSS